MACFADINVSQDSVATYARYGGNISIRLTANLPRNLLVKKILKSVKIWQNYGHESVPPFFWPTLYAVYLTKNEQRDRTGNIAYACKRLRVVDDCLLPTSKSCSRSRPRSRCEGGLCESSRSEESVDIRRAVATIATVDDRASAFLDTSPTAIQTAGWAKKARPQTHGHNSVKS